MIACPGYNAIHIGPPKTATLAIRRWLQRNYGGVIIGGYHQAEVPKARKDYFKFISVRDPEDRLWSWFQWEIYQIKVNRGGRWKGFENHTGSFEAFISFLMEQRGKTIDEVEFTRLSPQATLTQYDYFKVSGADAFVRVEHLVGDLARLPFVEREIAARIQVARETPGKEPKRLSHRDRRLILEYCPEDFETFGYEAKR